MSVQVDHYQRRVLILERAFELFAEEGFDGVTYQKIASRCGISRTSIYRYFKDKDQIFIYAIKLATDKMSNTIRKVINRPNMTISEKMRRILHLTVRLLDDNKVFMSVVLDYLTSLKLSGGNVRKKAQSRTFGFRFLLTRLITEGIERGVFRPGKPELIAGRMYSIIEAYVLNLTVTDTMTREECLALIDFSVNDCLLQPQSTVQSSVKRRRA
ncbi:MAG: TetR/AcrR family transcriptional regulator [Thermoguttaceae bacterium]|jgi:AcrR family transcriptional regulator